MIALLVAANAALTNPSSQATVSATGGGSSGGSLPAGTYYASYNYNDGWGQSTIGSSRSASFTIASGNIPTITFNDSGTIPAGTDFRNIYLTVAGGAAGTEVLYATGIAKATTTFNMSYAGPQQAATALEAIPSSNTTGASNVQFQIDCISDPNTAWITWQKLTQVIDQFIAGRPVDWYWVRQEVQRFDNLFAAWRQLTADISGLLVANPGSLHWKSTNVMPQNYRTFP